VTTGIPDSIGSLWPLPLSRKNCAFLWHQLSLCVDVRAESLSQSHLGRDSANSKSEALAWPVLFPHVIGQFTIHLKRPPDHTCLLTKLDRRASLAFVALSEI